MHHFLPLLLFASSTFALSLPRWGPEKWYGHRFDCLTYKQAYDLVDGFTSSLDNNFNYTAANELIAEQFTLTSQGLNSVSGRTGDALQGVTFGSKQALLESQAQRTFPLSVKILSLDAVACETIAWRWRAIANNGTPLRAISIFHTIRNRSTPIGWQIQKIYGEFDSLTWAIDFGANVTLAPPSTGTK